MTVLLLDDHTLFRQGIAHALTAEQGFRVLHCGAPRDALALLHRDHIDVALVDYDLGAENGLAFINRARQEGFSAPILILTAGLNLDQARQVVAAGVAGIFVKDQSVSSLIEAVELVAAGETVMDPRYYEAFLPPTDASANRPDFTERERETLDAVLEGLANKEIAVRMNLTESAVKATIQRLFEKTGVRSRTQLVRFALEKLEMP
ncbi:MAG TPA: response regulator transcription factor [Bryobacteraceae bacterium]|nr:response regulator transcription factor [Bryobacteraceae bacterium]